MARFVFTDETMPAGALFSPVVAAVTPLASPLADRRGSALSSGQVSSSSNNPRTRKLSLLEVESQKWAAQQQRESEEKCFFLFFLICGI